MPYSLRSYGENSATALLRARPLAVPIQHLGRFTARLKAVPSRRLLPALFLGVLLLLGASDNSTRIDRLGHQVICVCGVCNQALLECNHVGCAYSSRMRNELVAAVDAGDNDSSILQAFIQKYGTTVLAAPPNTGWVNRAAWVMPYAALVLGIMLVVFVVRTWRKRPLAVSENVLKPVTGAELDRFREQARKETGL
jgi:cytochrome c-type biogenesis protein CcmH/NrfF